MSDRIKNLEHIKIDTPEELEDLQDWWRRNGNRISALLCVVLAGLLAYNLYARHLADKAREASTAYGAANSAEAMEAVVAAFADSAVAPLALLRLGSDYYHRQKYALAAGAYETFLRDHAQHELAPIAIVGQAHVWEAQGKLAAAETRFREFAGSYPEHYLTPLAVLGQARATALQGRRDEARAILDRMLADRAGTPWAAHADDLLAALPRLAASPAEPVFADLLRGLGETSTPAEATPAEATPAEEAPAPVAAPADDGATPSVVAPAEAPRAD